MVNFPKLKYLCLHLLSQGGNFLKQSPILKTEFLKKKKNTVSVRPPGSLLNH